ncbi:hypothetical protein BGZ59_007561 [Podila verticillata]|nr:hypothetical protein BGZ59_007561 [Podila verticillata]
MLFNSNSAEEWDAILDKYSIALDHHVASKKDDALTGLDEWYQSTLPAILATRKPQSIDSSELCKLMSWKLKRGKFRPNLAKLAASNTDSSVKLVSQKAFALISSSSLKAAIAEMSNLKGGITKSDQTFTISAILCAAAPDKVPFMADETMASVPGLGPIAYTAGYYLKFAEKVIDKAAALKRKGAKTSSPHLVEKALWTEYMLDKYVEKKVTSSSSAKAAVKKSSEATKGESAKEKETQKTTLTKRKDVPLTGDDDQEDKKKKLRSSSRITRSA